MDIDLLSKMVKELILFNDRVSLPGLGCFIAEIVPASFSDKGFTINPPYRRLYFRSQPDDGELIVKFYAESGNLEEDVARNILTGYVKELVEVLKVKKTIVFPGLGRLRATKENNFFFISDEDVDIYPEGFGLEAVSLKTHGATAESVANLLDSELFAVEEVTESVVENADSEVTEPSEEIVNEVTAAEDLHEEMEVAEEAVVAEEEENGSNVTDTVEKSVMTEEEKYAAWKARQEAEKGKKRQHSKKKLKALWISLAVVAALALIVGVYFILAEYCPDFINDLWNSILYTEEELDILNL